MGKVEKILNISEELFFKLGARSVSMDNIAEEAGISKKTLYTRFAGKDDLVRQVVQKHIKDDQHNFKIIASSSENAIQEMVLTRNRAIEVLNKISDAAIHDMHRYYKSLWCHMQQEHSKLFFDHIVNNIHRGRREGFYIDEFDERIVAKLYTPSLTAIINSDIFPHEEYTRKKVIEVYTDLLMRSITTKKGMAKYYEYK